MEWRAPDEVAKRHCATDDDDEYRQATGPLYQGNILYVIATKDFQGQNNESDSRCRIHGNAEGDASFKKIDIPSPADKCEHSDNDR